MDYFSNTGTNATSTLSTKLNSHDFELKALYNSDSVVRNENDHVSLGFVDAFGFLLLIGRLFVSGIAFFQARIGLIKHLFAAKAALLSATISLAGGIIGTLHHLYFSGTPMVALAFGSVFSALEVVPLILIAWMT